MNPMEQISTHSAIVQVLSTPEILWLIFSYLDDSELRPLAYMPEFIAFVRDSSYARSRRRATVRFTQMKLLGTYDAGHSRVLATTKRPHLHALIHNNLIKGGLMTLHALQLGLYIMGPEHCLKVHAAHVLTNCFIKRNLTTLLNNRLSPNDLVHRNIFIGAPATINNHSDAITNGIAARLLVAPRAQLEWEHNRAQLSRKLRTRPSLQSLLERGVVPVAGVLAPQYYNNHNRDIKSVINNNSGGGGSYLPLLSQQVALAYQLRVRRIHRQVAISIVTSSGGGRKLISNGNKGWNKSINTTETNDINDNNTNRVKMIVAVWLRQQQQAAPQPKPQQYIDDNHNIQVFPKIQDKVKFYEQMIQ